MLVNLSMNIDPTVSVITSDLVDNSTVFDSSGVVFLEDGDSFAYDSITGNSFIGCSGLAHRHEFGERLLTFWGYRVRDVLAPFELATCFDEDKFVDTIVTVLDKALDTSKEIYYYLYGGTNPRIAHPNALANIVESQGGEYVADQTEEKQRWLAMTIADILKGRGSTGTFQFIAYLLTGYMTNVRLKTYCVPFGLDDTFGEVLGAPKEFTADASTTGLWRVVEQAPPVLSIPNEVSGGPSMKLDNLALWSSVPFTDMFEKDSLLFFFDTNGVTVSMPHYPRFAIEMMFKFVHGAVPNPYPQIIMRKGNAIVVTRTDKAGIKVEVTDGVNTLTLNGIGVLDTTDELFSYIGILYTPDEFALSINGILVDRYMGDTLAIPTCLDMWEFGGIGPNFLKGYLSLLKISRIGYLSNFSHYFEHIRKARTVGNQVWSYPGSPPPTLEEDELTYIYYGMNKNSCLQIEVMNDDGDPTRHSLIEYLLDEYLGAGCNEMLYGGHWPLELEMNVF